jgi:hypothetical protein
MSRHNFNVILGAPQHGALRAVLLRSTRDESSD